LKKKKEKMQQRKNAKYFKYFSSPIARLIRLPVFVYLFLLYLYVEFSDTNLDVRSVIHFLSRVKNIYILIIDNSILYNNE